MTLSDEAETDEPRLTYEWQCQYEYPDGRVCRETPAMVNLWVHGPLGHEYVAPQLLKESKE